MKEAFSFTEPASCQIKFEWTGTREPKPLSQKLIMEGSIGPKWFSVEYPPPPSASECIVT